MDSIAIVPWLALALGLVGSGFGFWDVVRVGRQRRRAGDLSLTAVGHVVQVDPFPEEAERGGHPVVVAFTDHRNEERHVRDEDGLGGYLLREGARVTVAYAEGDPDVARITEVVGPTGVYSVDSAGSTPRLGQRLVPFGAGLVLAAAAAAYLAMGSPSATVVDWGPFAGLSALGMLLLAVLAVAVAGWAGTMFWYLLRWWPRALASWPVATATVTDVWQLPQERSQWHILLGARAFALRFAAAAGY